MSSLPFKINSDVNANVVNTNLLNATNANITNAIIDNIALSDSDLPVGGSYKIGGAHVLSTPVQASSIAIGNTVPTGQGAASIAIGLLAGDITQSNNSIAIGSSAGKNEQGGDCVAIGTLAGFSSQGGESVAIGSGAGSFSQGLNSICIGKNTQSPNFNNTIVIGTDAQAGGDSEFVLGSSTFPLTNTLTAGASSGYLVVRLNGDLKKIQLFDS